MTTTDLETELRGALRERASALPADATARLIGIDYAPRSRKLRPPVAFAALAGAAGTAAAVSIIGLGAGTTSAFAGWTATPTRPSGDQTATAVAGCRGRFESIPAPPTGPKPPTATDLRPVLTDTRGPFTFVILAGTNATTSCVTGPGFTSISGSAGPGVGTVPAGKVALVAQHMTTRDGRPYTLVQGHVGAGVTDTTLERSDGSQVKASISNGWFAAWWPGATEATTARVATPQGVTTQHLDTGGPKECGPGPCTRSTTGAGRVRVTRTDDFGLSSTSGSGSTSRGTTVTSSG